MQHAYEILSGPRDSGSDSNSASKVKAGVANLKQKRPKAKRLGSHEKERVEPLVPYGPSHERHKSKVIKEGDAEPSHAYLILVYYFMMLCRKRSIWYMDSSGRCKKAKTRSASRTT